MISLLSDALEILRFHCRVIGNHSSLLQFWLEAKYKWNWRVKSTLKVYTSCLEIQRIASVLAKIPFFYTEVKSFWSNSEMESASFLHLCFLFIQVWVRISSFIHGSLLSLLVWSAFLNCCAYAWCDPSVSPTFSPLSQEDFAFCLS